MNTIHQLTIDDLNAPESFNPYRNATRPQPTSDILTFRERAPYLDDNQILDFILGLTNVRDKQRVAETLMDYFGTLKNILEARPDQLRQVNGVSEKTATLIASFLPVMQAWQRRQNEQLDQLANVQQAGRYCKSLVAGKRVEEFWVICLNVQCKVIGTRRISTGTITEVSSYPRLIMETALNYNAYTIMLTHNHPGGTPTPSAEDIASTLKIQQLMNGVDIKVLDHIIVAGDITYSMVQHGDMDYRIKDR